MPRTGASASKAVFLVAAVLIGMQDGREELGDEFSVVISTLTACVIERFNISS